VRSIPLQTCVKVAIDAWTSSAGLVDGHVFRPVNLGDKVPGGAMSEKVVWQMLQKYAADAGVRFDNVLRDGLARRRTVLLVGRRWSHPSGSFHSSSK
jgi:hypothetical protein